jgi:hypothetical protein
VRLCHRKSLKPLLGLVCSDFDPVHVVVPVVVHVVVPVIVLVIVIGLSKSKSKALSGEGCIPKVIGNLEDCCPRQGSS